MLTTKFDAQLTWHAKDIAVATYLMTMVIIYISMLLALFIGDRFWIEGYLRKCFFHGEIKELLLKNN